MEDKTARTAQREDRGWRGSQSQADVSVPVELQRLDPDLPLPAYAHPGDAGADLVAAEDVDLRPGERALVRTGIAIALPPGYVGLVHPRSGLAARLGVTVLNAPGTVDAGYRGEILVNLVNLDRESTAKIRRGDRIAQLVVQQVERAHFHVVDRLPPSRRGAEGHGSTGGHAGLAGDRSGSPSSAEPDWSGDRSGSRRGVRLAEPDWSETNGEVE